MNCKRWLLLICVITCIFTIFKFKHFVNYDVRKSIKPSLLHVDNAPVLSLKSIQRAARGFPNSTSQITVLGSIDAKRTGDLARRASRILSRRWWRGQSCACDRPITNYIFDIPPAVTTQQYWSEAFVKRTVISISHPEFSKECIGPFKISLLTQLSSNRFGNLELMAQKWIGPMNVALYVKPGDLLPEYTKVNNWLVRTKRRNIIVHLVAAEGDLYPVNWLRNLVIKNSSTEYVFMVDGDFIPSDGLELKLRTQFQELAQSKSDNTILIVPAFEITHSKVKEMPRGRKEVLKLIDKGHADVFHRKTYPAGHALWEFNKWKHTSKRYFLYHMKSCSEKAEPYMAMRRSQSPYLPEILLHRQKNKIAYFFELCNSGKRFAVVPGEYVIHKYHPTTSSQSFKVTMCVEDAWEVFRDQVLDKYSKTALYKVSFVERFKTFRNVFTCLLGDFVFCSFILLPLLALIWLCSSRYV